MAWLLKQFAAAYILFMWAAGQPIESTTLFCITQRSLYRICGDEAACIPLDSVRTVCLKAIVCCGLIWTWQHSIHHLTVSPVGTAWCAFVRIVLYDLMNWNSPGMLVGRIICKWLNENVWCGRLASCGLRIFSVCNAKAEYACSTSLCLFGVSFCVHQFVYLSADFPNQPYHNIRWSKQWKCCGGIGK